MEIKNWQEHAWIWNLAISDKLYKKYSICPDIRLDRKRAVHCSLWRSPLDWKLGACDVATTASQLSIHSFCLH